MLRNRPTPSRATPATLCQKCLKKGHYSYECTSSVQERPYTSRASRTQQLANPKLRPKLNTNVPDEFIKTKLQPGKPHPSQNCSKDRERKEGVASPPRDARRRSRSASYASVSTISTSRSRSTKSPPSSKRLSYPRQGSPNSGHRGRSNSPERNFFLRGTYRVHKHRRGRKRDRSVSSSSSRQENDREPQIRRRRSSVSPALRGRPLYSNSKPNISSSESRSHSRRHRNAEESGDDRQTSGGRPQKIDQCGNNPSNKTSLKSNYHHSGRPRSLSPYSKRLMLTRAMNTDATSG